MHNAIFIIVSTVTQCSPSKYGNLFWGVCRHLPNILVRPLSFCRSCKLFQNNLLINLILLALRQITKLIIKYTTALSVILIKDPELKCSRIMPLAV